MSRPKMSRPPASVGSFYDSVITAIFGSFTSSYMMIAGFAAFIGLLAYSMVKTKWKNDYGLIYMIFVSLCFVGKTIFHRWYPNSREMIPFYPVMVLVVADALKYIKSRILTKSLLVLTGSALCVQFILRINITGTKDWNNNYRIRNEIFSYALTSNIAGGDKAEFQNFIDDYRNPVAKFYALKLGLFIND
jgi:hypothetical protein